MHVSRNVHKRTSKFRLQRLCHFIQSKATSGLSSSLIMSCHRNVIIITIIIIIIDYVPYVIIDGVLQGGPKSGTPRLRAVNLLL